MQKEISAALVLFELTFGLVSPTPAYAGPGVHQSSIASTSRVNTGAENRQLWSDVSVSATHGASQDGFYESDAQYVGLRYTIGSRSQQSGFGVAAEVGRADIFLRGLDWGWNYTNEVRMDISAGYWLLGPVYRMRISHHSATDLEFSLLGGSARNSHVDSLGLYKVTFSRTFSTGVRLAASINAMWLDLNDIPNTVSSDTAFTGVGAELGYSF